MLHVLDMQFTTLRLSPAIYVDACLREKKSLATYAVLSAVAQPADIHRLKL